MSVKQLFDLTGQVALVTGGSRGLGLQMAEALGEMGAKLAITARKADELAQAKAHLEGLGYEVETVVNDLSKFDQIPAMVDQVLARFGTIDILFNNAGIGPRPCPVHELATEDWGKVIDVDLLADIARRLRTQWRCAVIVVAGNVEAQAEAGRHLESAGRNWLAGVSAAYSF